MNCNHAQCCICLKRECQQSLCLPRFKRFGSYVICGESCIQTAIDAARRLGGVQEQPCGRAVKDSADVLSEPRNSSEL